jgi:recombinational DNA repair protein (RecF pathway)
MLRDQASTESHGAHPPGALHALWAGASPLEETGALLRFFATPQGELLVKARGLRKPASKLAPLLKPADELLLSLARGRTGVPVLRGASLHWAHPAWREDLRRLALYWLFLECACLGSAAPKLNEQVFQLVVNLLRSEPATEAQQHAALAVFGLKLLRLHGQLPSLEHCCLDGHPLAPDEPAHLLPSGEGLAGVAAYNAHYARTASGLLRLDAPRLARWRALAAGPLLDYPRRGADRADAATVLHLLSLRLEELAGQPLKTPGFLRQQWRLPSWRELAAREG